MRLAAMRYKDFVWPYNPRTYTIDYERRVAAQKVPFGRYRLQDLGLNRRVMRGEGEFVGQGAYDIFKALASVFYDEGPGPLIHPVWQAAEAYFVELRLRQEPRPDYVAYAFTFWEDAGGESGGMKVVKGPGTDGDGVAEDAGDRRAEGFHTVERGETLWGIARDYGVDLTELIALNPQIKNPNLILPGERVRVA